MGCQDGTEEQRAAAPSVQARQEGVEWLLAGPAPTRRCWKTE